MYHSEGSRPERAGAESFAWRDGGSSDGDRCDAQVEDAFGVRGALVIFGGM